MNICNFAKSLITRSTKDREYITYWDDKNIDLSQESPKIQSSPKYDITISPAQRHEHYTNFTASYPKMQVPIDIFRRRLPKLQKNITTNSNWTQNNKTQDKTKLIEAFSLYSWESNLSQQQLKHS